MHAQTLCEAFQSTAAEGADRVALRTPDGATEISWTQYAERVRTIAAGLAALGVGHGDTVALMLTNRPEFHLVDTAAMHLGAIPYSIYATNPKEAIAHLFDNAGNAVVVCEAAFLPVLRAGADEARGGGPEHWICVEEGVEGTSSLAEVEAAGDSGFDFDATWRAVAPDDGLTLIYTSGTTGPPKGVELTHAGMLAQVRALQETMDVGFDDVGTSYLPSAHIADRWSAHYHAMCTGLQVVDVADPRAVVQVLPAVRPTVWGAVPRVVEKLKAGLEAAVGADPDDARRAAVQRAIAAATERVRLEHEGQPVPEALAAELEQLEPALAGLRAKLGFDRVRWFGVGAAPLARHVQEFLLALGLPVTEIYGMSEASCCITVARPDEARIGTVGPAIPGVEVRLAEDGEVLAKGPTLMRGYRGEPEKTAEAIDEDGWLHTGDIGVLDDDGHLSIVDRKKELIINAAGKNMSPANIESTLKGASPLIGQVTVIGEGRPYNVALVVLDPDAAAAVAAKLGLEDPSVAAVARDSRVVAQVEQAIEAANAKLSRVEQVKRHVLLDQEWLPGGDELTPTMKLRRKPIAEKYAPQVEQLYGAAVPA